MKAYVGNRWEGQCAGGAVAATLAAADPCADLVDAAACTR